MTGARDIEQRAALWVLRSEEPGWSAADQDSLDRWLAESDAHKAAFWRLEHGWREADRIGSLGDSGSYRPRATGTGWWKPLAVAASLLLVFSLFLLRPGLPFIGHEQQVATMQFATPVGGHQLVSLSDGSRVELNTDTLIKAAIGARSRSVWLEQGEAYFHVAKHAGRSFVVHAGARTISVLGTKFSVRRDGPRLAVAVVEGRVRLAEGSGDAQHSMILNGGEIAVASERSTTVFAGSAEDVRERLAWRDGRLLFDGSSLADAAREFNRYNRKQLVIEGTAAARVRIGGSFQARNVDGFARLLKDAYGLKVQPAKDKILVSS